MMRHPARDRAHLPCARLQGFFTRSAAQAYAAHTDRSLVPEQCACGRWHAVKVDPETFARIQKQREDERIARVAAYAATARRER